MRSVFKKIAIPLCLVLGTVIILSLGKLKPLVAIHKTEILWDTWGVPHIEAKDNSSLFQAFGWAQAQSHGNLILRLYGQSRGKAAEYWGDKYFGSDEYVNLMGIPARAKEWYQGQSQEMRAYVDAFAAGINQYIQQNPTKIESSLQKVLPVTGVDVLAHLQRVIYFYFVTNSRQASSLNSNAWAIAPSNSASNHGMLLANPHLPWFDLYTLYEAQLTSPDIDVYGATLVGVPLLAIAFNDNLGWTLTVNPVDGADIYELTPVEGGYKFDGQVKAFETETKNVFIGKNISKEITIQKSIHGPVIGYKDGKAYALRVVGLDQPKLLEQLWQMASAKNLGQFEASLKALQLPMFNILYADKDGQIFYLFNAQIPVRGEGNWEKLQGIIPGDSSKTLWTKYHAYEELPRVVNPPTGWLQNTNDPPWTSTFPPVLSPQNYPAYFAPDSLEGAPNLFRTQRSLKMLQESPKISFEQMIEKKFSSRLELADRVLDQLIPTVKMLGSPVGIEAAKVLAAWDRQTNPDSKGAVLFYFWASSWDLGKMFAKPWSEKDPLNTPSNLADVNQAMGVLEGVAAQVKLLYGSLDVSWGEVVRMRHGNENLPAVGGPGRLGSFRVLDISSTKDEKFQVTSGDSYIAAIEFSKPVKAKVLTVYGNSSQPGSPHLGDQLKLYARNELRDVWRSRKEIEAHLEYSTPIN